MKPKVVLYYVGRVLLLEAFALLSSALVAWAYAEWEGILWMAASAAITSGFGFGLVALSRAEKKTQVTRRDAFGIVTLAWIAVGVLGAVPYLFSHTLEDPVDAIFESVSGFTTTGSSVIAAPEALPHFILYWRSLTQWLGGMGIVVLFVAVFAELGVGGRFLFTSEVPGPITETMRPRIRDTSIALWRIYTIFTACEVGLLVLEGVEPFEALCHAFTTMSTGGFSTRDDSLASFPASAQWTVIAFMVVAGSNFSLFQAAFSGRFLPLLKDREFITYVGLLLLATFLIALSTLGRFKGLEESLRHSAFQVVSIATTTGYVTDDFNAYPPFAKILLVILMFVGGCAGSTAGGIKVVRLAIMLKAFYRGLLRQVRPHAVVSVRLGNNVIPEGVVEATSGFFFSYLAIFACVSLFVAAHGLDMATSLSATAATLGNIGPGLEQVGATSNFASLPSSVKVALTFCMILGRLEIYTVLGALTPSFWRR